MDTTEEEEARHINMTIKVLKEQVEVLTSQLEPHDTGHIHTTISTLRHRIGELENQRKGIAEVVSQEVIDQVRIITDPNEAKPCPKEGESIYINFPESKEDNKDIPFKIERTD